MFDGTSDAVRSSFSMICNAIHRKYSYLAPCDELDRALEIDNGLDGSQRS